MHPDLLNNPTFLRYYEMWQRDPKSLVFAPLADFFCQYKLFADARKICEAGVKHNPTSVLAHLSLARVYIYTREWHSARHEAQWVLARTPKHEGAIEILLKVEQSQAPVTNIVVQPSPVILNAVKDLKRDSSPLAQNDKKVAKPAAKPARKSWQTVTMAKIYTQQGHYFKARTIYKTILTRDPQNAEALAGLTSLERQMRDAVTP